MSLTMWDVWALCYGVPLLDDCSPGVRGLPVLLVICLLAIWDPASSPFPPFFFLLLGKGCKWGQESSEQNELHYRGCVGFMLRCSPLD